MTNETKTQKATTCSDPIKSGAGPLPTPPTQSPTPPAPGGAGSAAKPPPMQPRCSAVTIRDALIPAMMKLAAGGHPEIDGATFRTYRDAMVQEGDSRDVLEQTLLEQVALAHMASFHLQAKAGMASTAEGAGIYATAAAKLMGEIRRTIVAVKELRSPPPPPSVSITTTQQVNMHGKAETDIPRPEEFVGTRSEVGSINAPGHNRIREILGQSPCRSEELAVAGTAD